MNKYGTNELISGEKPFFVILSNLGCLFIRLIVDSKSWVNKTSYDNQEITLTNIEHKLMGNLSRIFTYLFIVDA